MLTKRCLEHITEFQLHRLSTTNTKVKSGLLNADLLELNISYNQTNWMIITSLQKRQIKCVLN